MRWSTEIRTNFGGLFVVAGMRSFVNFDTRKEKKQNGKFTTKTVYHFSKFEFEVINLITQCPSAGQTSTKIIILFLCPKLTIGVIAIFNAASKK